MSKREKHDVKTTMGMVSVVGAQVSYFNGTGSLAYATDQNITLSGTSPGGLRIQLPMNNLYNQTISWHAAVETTGTVGGQFRLLQAAHSTSVGTYDMQFVTASSPFQAVNPPVTTRIFFTAMVRDAGPGRRN